jgi:hypothetical protein
MNGEHFQMEGGGGQEGDYPFSEVIWLIPDNDDAIQ